VVGGKTCDSHCHLIICGDGRREDTEQCDDNNTTNLDGCDSVCKFEQDQRANSLKMSFDTTVCSKNALGKAIQDPTNTAQSTLQMSIDSGIKDGSMTVAMKFMGLDDLTGTSSTAPFSIGVLHASPVAGTGYDGTNDLDWWYTTDSMSIDGMRNPLSTLPNGKFAAGKLTAGPGTLALDLVLGGSPASLTMYGATVAGSSSAASAPTQSASGATPGHLTTENDGTFKTFSSLAGGKLCGNISARSLYTVAAPMAVQTNCDEGFTASNTLLDAIVVGCHKTIGFCPFCTHVTVIAPTQPDGSIDGKSYMFTHSGSSVTGCTGGAAWMGCLDEATYSGAFQFTADRVIAK
jgi:cysteine-rich repeat protein